MGKLTLILGGARSGKSSYALKLAEAYDDVLFVATAQAYDDEMRQRIERHKAERPFHWQSLEAPTQIGEAILQTKLKPELVLVDCLTLLASNIVLQLGDDVDVVAAETAVLAEVESLIQTHQQIGADTIVISNEVGLGIVPAYSLGRTYHDTLGRANQYLAAQADEVLFMVAGLPTKVK